ncbi:MAG TPA: hypothetical protein VFS10_07395 [Pyrinomonadaceae bacterium]|nr:hypothetical protein [Pyrinomonadaceae bacterium]
MQLLRELNESGTTVCMVTHDPRYALYANRTIHLFDGCIVKNVCSAEEAVEERPEVAII